jgi:hypothetical protein
MYEFPPLKKMSPLMYYRGESHHTNLFEQEINISIGSLMQTITGKKIAFSLFMSLIGYQKGKKTEFRLFELEQEQSTD